MYQVYLGNLQVAYKAWEILKTLNDKITLGMILIDWNDHEVALVKNKCKICSEVPKASSMLYDEDDILIENFSFNKD